MKWRRQRWTQLLIGGEKGHWWNWNIFLAQINKKPSERPLRLAHIDLHSFKGTCWLSGALTGKLIVTYSKSAAPWKAFWHLNLSTHADQYRESGGRRGEEEKPVQLLCKRQLCPYRRCRAMMKAAPGSWTGPSIDPPLILLCSCFIHAKKKKNAVISCDHLICARFSIAWFF